MFPRVDRISAYGAVSVLLAYLVANNALQQRGDFFTTCIHLTRSSVSLLVLLNLGLFLTVVLGRLLLHIFFGPLRAVEIEHLYEKSWYAVTETALAMTIFRGTYLCTQD